MHTRHANRITDATLKRWTPSALGARTGSARRPALIGALMALSALTTLTAVSSSAAAAAGDLIIHDLSGFAQWSSEDYRAYAVGRVTCNIGGVDAVWAAGTSQHPVFGQNMFRLADGRFEQIGQSWLSHGFCALNLSDCGECSQATDCSSLAAGCSTANTAGTSGSQAQAGPKYEVNATTGLFPYPPANPPFSGSTDRRLRVARVDVEAASNPGALYWIESQVVHFQDAAGGRTSANNASYRQVALAPDGTMLGFAGETVTQTPAIAAWAELEPDVVIVSVKVPNGSTVIIGGLASDNGDGTWDYEYAVQNLDFDRAVGRFALPVGSDVAVSGIGFHDVDYHSGEIWDGTDWTVEQAGGSIAWRTEPYDVMPNANALRWGTLYNFRFTADAPPATITARLDVFEPGSPSFVTAPVIGPAPSCPADLDGSGDVGFPDLLAILSAWGPCDACPEDIDGSRDVDFGDLLAVISTWGPCEP